MTTLKFWRTLGTAVVACSVGAGLAYAKLPPPSDEAKAKAEEAKTKAADVAKKEAEVLATTQDRVVERYRKEKGIKLATPTPAPKKK